MSEVLNIIEKFHWKMIVFSYISMKFKSINLVTIKNHHTFFGISDNMPVFLKKILFKSRHTNKHLITKYWVICYHETSCPFKLKRICTINYKNLENIIFMLFHVYTAKFKHLVSNLIIYDRTYMGCIIFSLNHKQTNEQKFIYIKHHLVILTFFFLYTNTLHNRKKHFNFKKFHVLHFGMCFHYKWL